METLKIKIPDGYEIANFDKESGEIKFQEKPKNVQDRIKTVEQVLADNGFTKKEFDDKYTEFSEDEKAYVFLKLLCKSLNEGWLPDWNNSSEVKYYPWFKSGSSGFWFGDYGGWRTGMDVGSRLCFKSSDLAKYVGTHFKDDYKKFMIIN